MDFFGTLFSMYLAVVDNRGLCQGCVDDRLTPKGVWIRGATGGRTKKAGNQKVGFQRGAQRVTGASPDQALAWSGEVVLCAIFLAYAHCIVASMIT